MTGVQTCALPIFNHVADRVGSIAEGKDADIVIWDGHPLHYLTKTDYVMVSGAIVHEKQQAM